MAGGPVGPPTAHQVQNDRVGGYDLPEKLADSRNGLVINVHHQPRFLVKQAIVALIVAHEVELGKGA